MKPGETAFETYDLRHSSVILLSLVSDKRTKFLHNRLIDWLPGGQLMSVSGTKRVERNLAKMR